MHTYLYVVVHECVIYAFHSFTTALLMTAPDVTTTPLNYTSFDVTWTIDESDYTHTFIVTWTATELCDTRVIGSVTVSGSTYTVTVLNNTCDYYVTVAATCGMINSGLMTVYGKN